MPKLGMEPIRRAQIRKAADWLRYLGIVTIPII